MNEAETIWFPGIYHGRTSAEYLELVSDITIDELIQRVQKRAEEDGEWAISNGFVGDNEEKMRRMMAWVSEETNIRQAFEYIFQEGSEKERTVDYVCRDLANGSKYAVR